MSNEENTSSHEDLMAVLSEASEASEKAEPEQETAAPAPVEEPTAGPARGADGKFAKRAEEAPPVTAEATTEPEQTTWEDRPPSSWKPNVREKWASLPDDVRQEILRREEAQVRGVRNLHEKLAPYQSMAQNLGDYMGDIHSKGGDPIGYTRNLLEVDRRLRNAPDPQAKFGVLLQLADAYRIPLREALNGAGIQMPAATAQPQQPQIPPEIARELQEMRQWRQQFTENTATNEVEHFGADKEFFNDVRGRMADLIESGAAQTLEEAYDMACWATPEVREVMLGRERTGAGRQQQAQRQQRAASASLPAGAGITVPGNAEDPDDVAGILAQEFARAASGRV